MELDPDYIIEHLDQIGKKQGLALLKEWIDSSTDQKLRQIALINYGSGSSLIFCIIASIFSNSKSSMSSWILCAILQ